MAKRKPLVYVAGEAVESSATDNIDINNGVVTPAGTTEERTLKDKLGEIPSVKDFGAKGDGTTDDTEAFEAAAEAGGVIYVPHGTYKVTDDIEGEFISFGHPTITGSGSVTILKDLFNAVFKDRLYEITGPGLGVSDSGKLEVDFSQANTSAEIQKALDDLMAALHLPKWLTSNTHFYVDNTPGVGQNIDDGIWGRSPEKPWATITYATNTIASAYNMNRYTAFIHIHAGTYNENFALGSFNRITGSVILCPYNYDDIVNIFYSGEGGTIINHTGGKWVLENLNLKFTILHNTSTIDRACYIVYSNSGSKAENILLRRCSLSYVDQTSPVDNLITNFVGVYSDGGNISIGCSAADAPSSPFLNAYSANKVPMTFNFSGTPNDSSDLSGIVWIRTRLSGILDFRMSGSSASQYHTGTPTINVSGSCTLFLDVTTGGVAYISGSGTTPTFSAASSFTGKKYEVTYGGSLRNLATKLPGSTAGSPEATQATAAVTVS